MYSCPITYSRLNLKQAAFNPTGNNYHVYAVSKVPQFILRSPPSRTTCDFGISEKSHKVRDQKDVARHVRVIRRRPRILRVLVATARQKQVQETRILAAVEQSIATGR